MYDEITNDNSHGYKGRQRRIHDRQFCNAKVSLRETGRSSDMADLLDLSETGCSIRGGPMMLAGGADLYVRLPGREPQRARQVWSNGVKTGLEFDEPLSLIEVYEVMHAPSDDSRAQSFSRRDQIGLGYAEEPLLCRKKPKGHTDLSGYVIRETKRNADHRREARYPVDMIPGASTLRVGDAELAIFDIAPSGFGVEGQLADEELTIGSEVQIDLPECDPLEARIVWMKNGRIGLATQDKAIDIFEAH